MTSEPWLPVPPPERVPRTGWAETIVPAPTLPTVACVACGTRRFLHDPCPRCGADPRRNR